MADVSSVLEHSPLWSGSVGRRNILLKFILFILFQIIKTLFIHFIFFAMDATGVIKTKLTKTH